MRVAYVSCCLKLEQNVDFLTWWKKDGVVVCYPVVFLAFLLSQLFPMLELVHLVDHLNFTKFCELAIWVMNRDLISLPVFCFVLNRDRQKVDVSWNYWYLERVGQVSAHHLLYNLVLLGLSDHVYLLYLLHFGPVWLAWICNY